MILGLFIPVWAELPPPDYRDELQAEAAAEIGQIAQSQGMEAADRVAQRWIRAIGEDSRVYYELGLAWRLAGDEKKALAALDQAIELSPDDAAAHYDRGEIRLNQGDLAGADADFQAVVRLMPSQWAGHFRLADLAGRQKDAVAFEAHLLEALRCGFSFRLVIPDPRWHEYLGDPVLGPVMRKLLLVYQDETVLQALEAPVQ